MSTISSSRKSPTRFERRKASTRARIVKAVEQLTRDRGVDTVTIGDITEAADVGHGTFYLHFKSKSDALEPVIEHLAEKAHRRVDRAAEGETDPALRVALGIRILLRAIAEDPLWSWYAKSGTAFSSLMAGMGNKPTEDLLRGLESGRFKIVDLSATVQFVDGAFSSIVSLLNEPAGTSSHKLADATAEMVLRVLGVAASEAAEIVGKPLRVVDEPDEP